MLLPLFLMSIDTTPIQLVPSIMMEIGTSLSGQIEITTSGLVLAEQFQNVDIMGNIQTGWADFLQTGKAATFAIGLVMGYTIRGITR